MLQLCYKRWKITDLRKWCFSRLFGVGSNWEQNVVQDAATLWFKCGQEVLAPRSDFRSVLMKLCHLPIHLLKWTHPAKRLPVLSVYTALIALYDKQKKHPTEQSNILWQQTLRASVANSVAISPKHSTRQSPAKHNHSQQSRLSYFCIILVKRSRTRKMSVRIFSLWTGWQVIEESLCESYVVCALFRSCI